ncbi:MAG: hypothetical protein F6K55_08885 [Moorea sp. SIO4A3]|nr:hypothetical protein [Moorena sp. SIO4A3]
MIDYSFLRQFVIVEMFILTSGTIVINRRWAVPTYAQRPADLICLKHCPPYLLLYYPHFL